MICGKGACLPASKRGRGSRGCVSQLMRAAFLTRAHFISNAGVSGNASRSFVRYGRSASERTDRHTDRRTRGETVSICVCVCVCEMETLESLDAAVVMEGCGFSDASFCMSRNTHYVMRSGERWIFIEHPSLNAQFMMLL